MRTGYSTESRYICNYLSEFYEVHCLAHNYAGQVLPPGVRLKDGFEFKFWVHGAGREQYCKDLIAAKIQTLKADVFGVLLDTFMLHGGGTPWITGVNLSPAWSFFYYPSDGGGFPAGCEHVLAHFNGQVAMSRYAQAQVKQLFNMEAAYIPHGVDTTLYRPFDAAEKSLARKEFTVLTANNAKVQGFLQGKFVVGVVARNQGRKMLDRSVMAFAEFCKDKPDAVLYFHSDPWDAAAVFDLSLLVREYHLENRVVWSPMRYFENFELKDMPGVYNVMDAFFLSTSGEGFGIPTLEAMSCGVPVVVTDYTTTPELVMHGGQAGLPVKVATEIVGTWNVRRAVMDVSSAVEALNVLYHDASLRERFGAAGREKAVNVYDWRRVLPRWKEYLEAKR